MIFFTIKSEFSCFKDIIGKENIFVINRTYNFVSTLYSKKVER